MFIRRKFDSDRNRTRVQIVHSVRDGSDIRAHIAICYMAFCCIQHLRRRLRLLGHTMRRQLNALQYSVLVKSATDEMYAMPSRASAQAKRIYRSVSLNWNE